MNLLGVVVLTSLGTWGLPQMIHKFYAIKDEKSINTGTVISTIFAIVVSGGCYFLGGFGRLFDGKELYDESGMIVFFIVVSVLLALDPPTFIAQLMGISWGALAGAFLAPFLYGLYWKGVTKAAVWTSFFSGIGITVSNMFFQYISSPINAGAIAMAAGLVIVPIVSVLTPKMEKDTLKQLFACYDEKVVISKKHSLEAGNRERKES